jgi:hypothetical protein
MDENSANGKRIYLECVIGSFARKYWCLDSFIIEYSSLRDFYRPLGNNNRSISIRGFLKDDSFLACVET